MPIEADYEFGRMAVRRDLLRQEQLEECIELLVALERVGSRQRIWDVVGRKGYIGPAEIQKLRGELECCASPGEETTEVPLPQIEQARSYALAHLVGNGRFHLFPVPQRLITIGRDNACDIVLPEKDIAPQQVRIRFSAQQHVIEDSGFGSGVLINHQPVLRQNLEHNDLIEAGSALLLFLLSGDSDIPEPIVPHNPVARITVTHGPRKSTTFFLGNRPIIFGSHALAAVRIPDESVVSFHAHLSQTSEGMMLADLKSGAGIRVNGASTARQMIKDGDNISIGAVTFSIREIHGQRNAATEAENAPAANVEAVPEYNVPDEPEIEPASDPMQRREADFPRAEPAGVSQPRAFKPGRLQLNCVDGNLAGQRFVLKKTSTIIGRDISADIRIEDGSVSRRHVEIIVGDKPPELRDLNSRNGVHVNGKRVQKAVLRPGDAIRIDKCLFIAEEVVRRKKA